MKKIFLTLFSAATLLTAVSCGPSSYTMGIEMRQPSDSGLDLAGKDIAVMYLDGPDSTSLDSRFCKAFAQGLSVTMADVNTQSDEAFVYRLPMKEGVNYACRDSLISLVLMVNADVIFLLEPTDISLAVESGRSGTCRTALHVYDTMNAVDRVLYFGGNTYIQDGVNKKNVDRKGEKAGREFAWSFRPNWKLENFPVLYYDSIEWQKAVGYAEEYKWKEAMDIWLKCLNTNNALRRSSAAYNLSFACYMLGDYSLALEWLDSSDKDCKLSINDSMRQRIEAAMKR